MFLILKLSCIQWDRDYWCMVRSTSCHCCRVPVYRVPGFTFTHTLLQVIFHTAVKGGLSLKADSVIFFIKSFNNPLLPKDEIQIPQHDTGHLQIGSYLLCH